MLLLTPPQLPIYSLAKMQVGRWWLLFFSCRHPPTHPHLFLLEIFGPGRRWERQSQGAELAAAAGACCTIHTRAQHTARNRATLSGRWIFPTECPSMPREKGGDLPFPGQASLCLFAFCRETLGFRDTPAER